ncbi:MAG: HAD family hydrolase [Actinobacteria bacterium]|nr:HAD family hydrolase [Actinomycetota bacterium]
MPGQRHVATASVSAVHTSGPVVVEAVTFDYWNTLVREAPGVREFRVRQWTEQLERAGSPVDAMLLDAAFDAASCAFDAANRAGSPLDGYETVRVALDVLAVDVDVDPETDTAASLVATMTDPPPRCRPLLEPNVAATLEVLRSAGVRIGIVCDVGLIASTTLRGYLAAHGVLDLFDHTSFSDEVGARKPDPAIFRHALAGLGDVAPEHAVHVGDLHRTDVAGAKAMGMTSVRYTGVFDDPDPDAAATAGPGSKPAVQPDHVIDDLGALPDLLGLERRRP